MFKRTGDNPLKFNNKRSDPEELIKRLSALRSCIDTYTLMNPYSNLVELDMKRPNINATCSQHMEAVKEFINRTGAGYENIYAPIQPYMVAMIKNTQL